MNLVVCFVIGYSLEMAFFQPSLEKGGRGDLI